MLSFSKVLGSVLFSATLPPWRPRRSSRLCPQPHRKDSHICSGSSPSPSTQHSISHRKCWHILPSCYLSSVNSIPPAPAQTTWVFRSLEAFMVLHSPPCPHRVLRLFLRNVHPSVFPNSRRPTAKPTPVLQLRWAPPPPGAPAAPPTPALFGDRGDRGKDARPAFPRALFASLRLCSGGWKGRTRRWERGPCPPARAGTEGTPAPAREGGGPPAAGPPASPGAARPSADSLPGAP